jgi:hypothetical protein
MTTFLFAWLRERRIGERLIVAGYRAFSILRAICDPPASSCDFLTRLTPAWSRQA